MSRSIIVCPYFQYDCSPWFCRYVILFLTSALVELHRVCVNGPSKRRYRGDGVKLFLRVADGTMRESDIKLQHGWLRLDAKGKKVFAEKVFQSLEQVTQSVNGASSLDVFELQLGKARADLIQRWR